MGASMWWWLLWACAPGSSSEASAIAARAPGWTILVWMDGDNNLESLVPGDLNELERAVGDDVRVLVQADRIPGYSRADGNWTGTRRYEIVADDSDAVVSPVVEDLGEVDMGSADALADFLLWGEARQPSEQVALVLWNHGGGFWIASDDTSGSHISLVGELESALMPLVTARGAPLDLVAFDACNMGQWETAVALRNTAQVAVASQAWVNGGGYAYDIAFPSAGGGADARQMGDALARSAAVDNDELTHAAVDVAATAALTDAVDGLATTFLEDPDRLAIWSAARDDTQGLDRVWEDWWLDLGGFADAVAARSADDAPLAAAAAAVRQTLDASVVSNYTRPTLSFASGLTIFADTSLDRAVDHYAAGPWAETAWDELVAAAAATEASR
jgi:hypothetical protein